jgi:small nuclear ribonucleoprotein (snRNP)-like protein
MQLVAKHPCREEMLAPHIGKSVIIVTTNNETYHGKLHAVRPHEIVLTHHQLIATTSQMRKKTKAKLKRFPFPPGPPHFHPRPPYPVFPGPIGYPPPIYPYPPAYYPPRYGAESLVLPLFLLATMYA